MRKFLVILFSVFYSISLNAQSNSVPPEVEFKNLLSIANIHLMKGENNLAMSSLHSCLKLQPNSSVANFEISRLFFDNRDYSAALNYALKAQSLNPDNKYYNLLLAYIYEALGDLDKSIKFYELSFPSDLKAQDFFDKFEIYLKFRKFDNALSILNNYEKLYGFSPSVGFRKAQVFELKNDLKQAENEYLRVISLDSSNFELYSPLIEFYIANNKLSEAQLLQDKISKKSETFALGQLSQALICRESGKMDCFYQNLVEFFGKDRNMNFDQKLQLLKDLLVEEKNRDVVQIKKIFEAFISNYPGEVKVHSLYSSFLMTEDLFADAVVQLRECLNIDKSDYQYYAKLFRVYMITEDYQNMKLTAEEAAELYPDQSEVFLFMGVADTYLGKFDDAESDFQMANDFGIELSNSYNLYNFYLGVHSYFINNKELAMSYFDKYYKSQDDNYYLLVQMAYFIIDYGKNLPLAETIIKQCSNFTNLNYFFYFVSAFLDLKNNRIDRAINNIEKSLSLNNQKYHVLNMAGDIYKVSGDCDKAVSMWKQSIDRGGNASVLGKKITNCK